MRILGKMAELDWEQKATVRGACDAAVVQVATARIQAVGASDADVLNSAASRAWQSYSGTVARTLTGEQGRRLAALRAATRH